MRGKKEDLTGKKFGRLTVMRQCENIGASIGWYCFCECSKAIKVRGYSLRNGTTSSCGCYAREVRSKRGRRVGSKLGKDTGRYNQSGMPSSYYFIDEL